MNITFSLTKPKLSQLMTSCLILAGSITNLACATENIDPTMAKAALPGILSNLNKLANDPASEESCKQRMALVYKYQKFAASVKQSPLSQKELNNHFLKNCIEASVPQEPKRSRSRDLIGSVKSKLRGSQEGKSPSTTEPTTPTRPEQPTPTRAGQTVPPRPTRALPTLAGQQKEESKTPSRRQAFIGTKRGQPPKTNQVGGPPEDMPPQFPGDGPPQDMPPQFPGDVHHQQHAVSQPAADQEESPKPGTLAWQLQQKKAQGLKKTTSGTATTGQASAQQGQSSSSVQMGEQTHGSTATVEAEKQAPQSTNNPMFAEMQRKQAERAKRLSQSGGVAVQTAPSTQYTLTTTDIARLTRRMAIEGDEEFKESLESQLRKAQKEQDKMKVAQLTAELAFVTEQMH